MGKLGSSPEAKYPDEVRLELDTKVALLPVRQLQPVTLHPHLVEVGCAALPVQLPRPAPHLQAEVERLTDQAVHGADCRQGGVVRPVSLQQRLLHRAPGCRDQQVLISYKRCVYFLVCRINRALVSVLWST